MKKKKTFSICFIYGFFLYRLRILDRIKRKISRDTGIAAYCGICIEFHYRKKNQHRKVSFIPSESESERMQENAKYFIDLMEICNKLRSTSY